MVVWPFRKITRLVLTEILVEKYENWMRPEILKVSIFHCSGECYLEIVNRMPKSKDLDEVECHIQVVNLSFISGFPAPSESIFDDAKLLLEDLTPYSIVNTLPLFTDEAGEFISRVQNELKPNK